VEEEIFWVGMGSEQGLNYEISPHQDTSHRMVQRRGKKANREKVNNHELIKKQFC
jgi:hypothetical protein